MKITAYDSGFQIESIGATRRRLLDPVYTAKAFSDMLGEMEMGRFGKDEPIIFLHTSVLSALFMFDANKLGMNF